MQQSELDGEFPSMLLTVQRRPWSAKAHGKARRAGCVAEKGALCVRRLGRPVGNTRGFDPMADTHSTPLFFLNRSSTATALVIPSVSVCVCVCVCVCLCVTRNEGMSAAWMRSELGKEKRLFWDQVLPVDQWRHDVDNNQWEGCLQLREEDELWGLCVMWGLIIAEPPPLLGLRKLTHTHTCSQRSEVRGQQLLDDRTSCGGLMQQLAEIQTSRPRSHTGSITMIQDTSRQLQEG